MCFQSCVLEFDVGLRIRHCVNQDMDDFWKQESKKRIIPEGTGASTCDGTTESNPKKARRHHTNNIYMQ